MNRILESGAATRWPVIIGYFAISALILLVVAPRIRNRDLSRFQRACAPHASESAYGTRIEETEPMVLHALDLIRKTVGKENVEITSDYIGVQPSSYPVNLIHLFTSGPEEALVQVQLRPGHPDDETPARRRFAQHFSKEVPALKMSFEAGDIVSQVMSFGSPTPVQIDVQGVDLDQDYAYLAKVEARTAKLSFLRDISVVQPQNYPTVEVKVDRRVRRSVRPDDGGCDRIL